MYYWPRWTRTSTPLSRSTFRSNICAFFRMRVLPDAPPKFTRYALAELEVYGRRFCPPGALAIPSDRHGRPDQCRRGELRLEHLATRTGINWSNLPPPRPESTSSSKPGWTMGPIAYHSFNDLAQPVEVEKDVYAKLKPRVWPWDPPAVGWQGVIADDINNWSFWSPPIRVPGQRPRVPKGALYSATNPARNRKPCGNSPASIGSPSKLLHFWPTGSWARSLRLTNCAPTAKCHKCRRASQPSSSSTCAPEFSDAGQQGFDAVRLGLALLRVRCWVWRWATRWRRWSRTASSTKGASWRSICRR